MPILSLFYGLFCYLSFLASFFYLLAFVGDLGLARSVSVGPVGAAGPALAVDLGLVALFGIQHSLMARPAFKRAWQRFVPAHLERSTYVLLSSTALALLFLLWRPLAGEVWNVRQPLARLGIQAGFWAGAALVVTSTFMVSHWDLFGLRQVWANVRGTPYREAPFRLTAFYARVRHPLMLGFLVVFWAAPRMTVGHLVFTLAMTAYILVGTALEEGDLMRNLGSRYAAYRREVPRFFPLPWRRAGATAGREKQLGTGPRTPAPPPGPGGPSAP
ncbi:methanethiol S-methyltransferase [Mesoterricola silvestris]|uniref:methanethiol S-methyltransferase n=1 Tax=Mesoterricola silvestris TaxID=2927979 RepID=A0AA48GLC0_9BACT|nr:methanethiol S-methyltransferase [Mesoterricola silvestris]BDU73497.1 membrane protein [Mesoterricola silvestris]